MDMRFRDTFAVELLLAGVPIETSLDFAGPPKRENYREALCTLGALATGTTGSGFGQRLEPRSARTLAKWGTPEVHGKEQPNNSFTFNKKDWCPGWESNPHEEKSPEDFKSSASAIPPPGRWLYKSNQEKRVLQHGVSFHSSRCQCFQRSLLRQLPLTFRCFPV